MRAGTPPSGRFRGLAFARPPAGDAAWVPPAAALRRPLLVRVSAAPTTPPRETPICSTLGGTSLALLSLPVFHDTNVSCPNQGVRVSRKLRIFVFFIAMDKWTSENPTSRHS